MPMKVTMTIMKMCPATLISMKRMKIETTMKRMTTGIIVTATEIATMEGSGTMTEEITGTTMTTGIIVTATEIATMEGSATMTEEITWTTMTTEIITTTEKAVNYSDHIPNPSLNRYFRRIEP
jgi:hypothetical protein